MKKCALFMAVVLAGGTMAYGAVYPVQTATVVPSQISGLSAPGGLGAVSVPGTLDRPGMLGPPIAVVPTTQTTTQTTTPAPVTGADPIGSPMLGLPSQLGLPSGWAGSSSPAMGGVLVPAGLDSSYGNILQGSVTPFGILGVPEYPGLADQFAMSDPSDPGMGDIPGFAGLGWFNGSTP